MKSSIYVTHLFILSLLVTARVVSAFNIGNRISDLTPSKYFNKFARVNVQVGMGRGNSARSQEEDLELTRAVIMKHIAIASDTSDIMVDDDDDDVDDEVDDAVEDKTNQSMKKIKSKLSKVKKGMKNKKPIKKIISKVKSKIKNNED